LLFIAFALLYLAILIGLGALVTDLPALRRMLDQVNLLWIAGACLLQLFTLVVVGLRWLQLMRPSYPVPITLTEAAALQVMVMGLNIILPGPGGDLAASYIMRKKHGVPISLSLAASIYARFSGLTMAAVLALLSMAMLPRERLPETLRSGLLGGAAAISLAVVLLLMLSLFPGVFYVLGGRLLSWVERWKKGGRGKLSALARSLGNFSELLGWCLHATATRGRRWVGASLLWSTANYLLLAGTLLCIGASLDLEMTPGVALFMGTVGSLMAVIMMVVPMAGLAEEVLIFSLVMALTDATAGAAVIFVLILFSIRIALLLTSAVLTMRIVGQARGVEMEKLTAHKLQHILDHLRHHHPPTTEQ